MPARTLQKAPHANCANPFKGKAARRRCRRLSTRFSHCCCLRLPHSLSPSRSARLNTQTVDEATCLENNLKAQKVSKATRIGTYPSPLPSSPTAPPHSKQHTTKWRKNPVAKTRLAIFVFAFAWFFFPEFVLKIYENLFFFSFLSPNIKRQRDLDLEQDQHWNRLQTGSELANHSSNLHFQFATTNNKKNRANCDLTKQ